MSITTFPTTPSNPPRRIIKHNLHKSLMRNDHVERVKDVHQFHHVETTTWRERNRPLHADNRCTGAHCCPTMHTGALNCQSIWLGGQSIENDSKDCINIQRATPGDHHRQSSTVVTTVLRLNGFLVSPGIFFYDIVPCYRGNRTSIPWGVPWSGSSTDNDSAARSPRTRAEHARGPLSGTVRGNKIPWRVLAGPPRTTSLQRARSAVGDCSLLQSRIDPPHLLQPKNPPQPQQETTATHRVGSTIVHVHEPRETTASTISLYLPPRYWKRRNIFYFAVYHDRSSSRNNNIKNSC